MPYVFHKDEFIDVWWISKTWDSSNYKKIIYDYIAKNENYRKYSLLTTNINNEEKV